MDGGVKRASFALKRRDKKPRRERRVTSGKNTTGVNIGVERNGTRMANVCSSL